MEQGNSPYSISLATQAYHSKLYLILKSEGINERTSALLLIE